MKFAIIVLLTVMAVDAASACPPPGMTRDDLLALKAAGFKIEDAKRRDETARALLACLGEPDPAIRDGVVLEGVSALLRAGSLSVPAMDDMTGIAASALRDSSDAAGFRRPFAAYILSELVRADRIKPFMSVRKRAGLTDLAAAYIAGVADYRGFDEKEGWRHGIAHAADLVLQLVVNPNIGAAQVKTLMDALSAKIAPADHAYVFGEPGRLARAVFFAHRRGVLTAQDWNDWFARSSSPAPFDSWRDGFRSEKGLRKRHNAIAFFSAIMIAGVNAGDEQGLAIASLAKARLAAIDE